ncbi:cilia- and flagella-associated protein 47 [Camelus ferus]|uniref:Cilia- and flagella-associated protein 47 n=1 Tax=Camelus ferus TaxID=419612 RepID=A0A8B8SLC3_CAMFR|nr:cilia- and flagella-associated protein 47 [Camelus ferus]
MQFKLLLTNLDKALASGLQTTAIVEYHPDKDEDTFDQLLISVGNKTLEIPLIGLIPSCQLEIESEVNFGILVANNKVHCKEINIVNHGTVPGMFKTEYQGQLPIVFFPNNGIVQPKSSMVIKVDFCADQPIIVNEVAKVSLQDRPDVFLNIKAHVVEQIIELLNMSNGAKLKCIRFGSVFFGASKIEQALLYNNSPEPINWVAIMQDDSVGEELGTNTRQRTDVALNNLTYLRKIKDIDVTTFISCVPNEGRLLPYQKIIITFCFSPKLIIDGQMNNDPSHRQDYAVFLRFESVGSKDGFLRDDNSKTIKSDQFQKVELALTGSGLPVLLQFDPGRVLNFAPCFIGGRSEIQCVMQNRSKSLPVMYHFKKTAHFKIDPQRGKIDEGSMQNVTCSFIPHQVGVFNVKQFIEIIGSVADETLQSSSLKPFHQICLYFSSVCKSSTKKVVMKINPGISPLVSNPTGQFVVENLVEYKDHAPVAMLQSTATQIHNHSTNKELIKDAMIAFPNDRAASIRSGDEHKHFRTIFTKIPRYTYVDPDFAYTEFEKIDKKAHENSYTRYIKYLRNVRLQKQAQRKHTYSYNDIDIGLQPASGLKSPTLSEAEIEEELSSAQCRIKCNQLLSTRNIASKETKSLRRKVLKGLKSEPSTAHEKHDCGLILTPKLIHQVIVGPSVLNFGDVCVNSTNTRLLHVINMLPMHILIQLDVNLVELRKTNQFSYVIPPTASTYISVVFESPSIGKFWKSFIFTVNNIPSGHILVMAVVLPVRLELSSNELVLIPHGFLVKTCFRGTVRLYNHQNYFVKFAWQPVNAGKRIAFSIRPAKGTVEPHSSLECEVTWQPDFDSPEKGEFLLHIDEGNTLTLKCFARLGHTKVRFLETSLSFSNSPQGLTTWRKATLHNVGPNHAYFKICDQSLLSTINIIPSQGIIPLGGLTVLNISCTSTVAEKFDTRAKVAIRHGNDIDLRIGGSVEIADVEISPDVFNFSGTYVGATQIIPFLVKNKGITRARVEFNLEDFEGFSVHFKDKSGKFTDPAFPAIYFLELEKETSLECGMVFSPKEVATYKFSIQVRINFFAASELYTQCCKSNTAMIPKTAPLIRPCYIQATVLQAPLRLSSTDFMFEILSHTMDPNNRITKTQDLVLHNVSKKDVKWTLKTSNTGKLFKNGIFKFSMLSGTLRPNEECNVSINFCPKLPRKYTADIPVRLNDNPLCYRMLCLVGEVKLPKLLFDPPFIFFTPVPLNVTTVMDINILPQSYFRDSTLSVQIPPATLLNGDEIQPLSANFPKGQVITGSPSGTNAALTCHFSFKSSKPVSFFTHVLFCDNSDNRFSLPVAATAENCILTIYSYMAIHLDKQKIIVKNDKDASSVKTEGKVLLPSRQARLPSPAPSKFSDAGTAKGRLFVGMEIIPERLESGRSKMSRRGNRSVEKEAKNEQFFFLEEGTKTYSFFQKVVDAAQTWFSLFGWPEGPHSLSIPETIRRDVYKIQFKSSAISPQKFSRQNDFSRYNKTIYDVMLHLSGKMLPGISSSQSLPVNYPERVIQLHLQHSLLLDFLNAQGACVSHILPEFLLELEDYKKWIEITSSTNTSPKFTSIPKEKSTIIIDMTKFEAWSKRSWTDVFLQIYKATDICDPNPILMLMFCVYMYERLPTYLPKKVVPFHCTLHDTVLTEILLKNPGFKRLVYNATIVGRDASDFSLSQEGNVVTISPKNQTTITLKFTSHFLHPAEASLLLISKPKNGIGGSTMTFALKGEVLSFKAIAIIKCRSPCYKWKEITVNVKNPFHAAGDFSVILVESSTLTSLPSQLTETGQFVDHMNDGGAVSSGECDVAEGSFHAPNALKTSIKSHFIKEFFCSTHTLHLGPKGTSNLELFFLPFDMHTRYCVIILSNKKIGELIYVLEGKGMLPLPSRLFPLDSSTPLDFSSSPDKVPTNKDPVLYLKSKFHQILVVDLKLPLINEAKEKALTFAAQQQISKIEYEKRLITGTLESSSIRVAVALLGLSKIETCTLFNISKLKKPNSISYNTELSLPQHFNFPNTVCIPQVPGTQVKLTQSQGINSANKTAADEYVPVPLYFVPDCPGRYPCKILLTSKYDVRVYCIEGVVNEEHAEARFDFETPAFKALTHNIPINNETNNEWKYQVTIEGKWFYGPPVLHVGPGETAHYPLTFKPILECVIMGRLILQNEDGMEHVFDIKGIGKRPLALEHITVNCQVGEKTNISIMVPNYTLTMLTFKVSSDLPMVWGKPDITIDPDNPAPYILHVCPWKRGVFKGSISFSVKSKQKNNPQKDSDQDKDEDLIPFFMKSLSEPSNRFNEELSDGTINNYRVWYYLEIHSTPAPPLKTTQVEGAALDNVCIKIPLFNPKRKIIHIKVQLSSAAFSGNRKLSLFPLQSVKSVIRYTPATTDCKEESIIFQPHTGIEFWYLLKVTTDGPEPTILPELNCDLGKIMNLNNEIALPPKGTLDIQVLFVPQVMKLQKTMVVVQMKKVNRGSWLIDNFNEPHKEVKRSMGLDSAEVQEICWIYPIIGFPQAPYPKCPQVVINCQSRKQVEEEVEVTVDGDFSGQNPILDLTDFIVIPKRESYNLYEDADDTSMKREFEYEIQFESEAVKANLESCVALYLMKKSYDMKNERITLVFSLIFAPKKPLTSHVMLAVECLTYGIWRFPMMLVATEPDVDDVIDIEGVGLFKESTIDLRLTSQTRNPEPFTAYFLPGSDPEFYVKPQIGELLPYEEGTEGTLIIVAFKPQMYSRKYKAKLVIETADMYWLYDINGLPPATIPPINVKAKIDNTNKMFDRKPVHRRNFIYENSQLIRTGVSSTIKGAPLMLKKK